MKLPKPYIAFLFNWNKEKRSTDIVFFNVPNSKTKKAIAHFRLTFIYEKTHLRVYKYLKIGRKTTIYLRPRESTEQLKEAEYLLVDKSDLPWDNKGLLEYCSAFKIQKPRIAKICQYCLTNRYKWTELEDDSLVFKDKGICTLCSRRELLKELQKTNLVVTAGLAKFHEKQARRKGSLDEILANITLGPDSDPVEDPDSTLFDIIPATKPDLSAKVRNIKQLPKNFKDLLQFDGIKHLLPIQKKAIESGLFENKNLLIVAGTSSGKTLIGEMAGVKHALKGKKFVYLSPLVALTNQKYEQFKRRYRKLGLRTSIRVGMSRIEIDDDKPIIDGSYQNSDIIVATYEAFDFILREGKSQVLGEIGVIVIDEIQMLMAKERGYRLNGLIARLKSLFPKVQFIYLSATIGNPEQLANDLSATSLTYIDRPIPLERHSILTSSEEERHHYLARLCILEEKNKSSTGYYGQTLVFTNSRPGCEKLAGKLKKKGVKATFYHAGLTFKDRKKIERGFEKGLYTSVVTTIALGAGVDFPASLVIFENLAMGAEWLSVAEFHQMLGRAGRLGFHDKGKVYMLVEPGRKIFARQDATEEQVAFELLTKPVENVEPVLGTIPEEEEILATIVAFGKVNIETSEKMIFANILGRTNPLKDIMRTLKKMEMITIKNKIIYPTKMGKAVTSSFLAPSFALRLIQEIKRQKKRKDTKDFALELAISIQPYRSAHLSSRMQAEVEEC